MPRLTDGQLDDIRNRQWLWHRKDRGTDHFLYPDADDVVAIAGDVDTLLDEVDRLRKQLAELQAVTTTT